ncbi:uncharacterized protein LOC143841896 [Paroedura picta]|uniref:uncharacterized protein LOC143841896 n=1 Tax=Paroedura picta TaxID=143630 RepID=UPI00405632ED
MMSARNLAGPVSWVESQRSAELWIHISLLGKSIFQGAGSSRAAARRMDEGMVQQQERPEEEDVRQDTSREGKEDGAERPLASDSPEECGPLQRMCLKVYLRLLAKQMDELDEQLSQDNPSFTEEGYVDEASALGSQEDIWPHPGEEHGPPLKVHVIVPRY